MNKTPNKFQKFLKACIVAVLVFSIFAPLVDGVQAQTAQISNINVTEQNDFVVEPGKVEAFLNPGETVVKSIIVTNRIKRKVLFKVVTEDFIGSTDEQRPVILLGQDRSPYSFKDNLIPAVDEFALEFGQRISIPVKIVVPKDAVPGGFYASVVISNQPDKEGAVGTSTEALARNRIISRLGVLFFVRVNGDVKESGQVEDFRLNDNGELLRQKGPVSFEILFNNTGSVHLVPYGRVNVTNIFGQKVADLPVDAYFALPNSTRYRTVDWDKTFLIGRYKATLDLNRGYGNVVDQKVLTFWVIPWKILAGVFAAVFLVIFILYYIVSRFEFKRKR